MERWATPPWWLWMLVQVSTWFFGILGVLWCIAMFTSMKLYALPWPPHSLIDRVVVAFGWSCLSIGVFGWLILRGTQTRWRELVVYGVLLLLNGALVATFGLLFE
ncbi:hypothetical protein [Herpetosiphon giganteus]|uniref:hypothetical protein n=1 Tax=Herpetosiphon giganteus TaxID=2029754 RepID=UPI00195E1E27|nr:hypothetical protein [Herpetosiphon giganteus]MBM7845722.1 hypothetical protein [Herpetosiphon giganteus]